MFACVRHAPYHQGTGSLTPEGEQAILALGQKLLARRGAWIEVLTSPVSRAKETAELLAQVIRVSVRDDDHLCMDGNCVDFLPPAEPRDVIFVSHLPVLTKLLRAWSRAFGQAEPPLTELACGYLVDPGCRTIVPIG